MRYLLDTNVVSELRRRRPDARVASWRTGVLSSEICISVLVAGEIRKGIEIVRERDVVRAREFEEWLEGLLRAFADRVLPLTVATADAWGRLPRARTLPVVDSLLLASAAEHGLTFVSREADRYADIGVPVLNPWH